MSVAGCPFSGHGPKPITQRRGPRGCAFSGFAVNCPYPEAYAPTSDIASLYENERKTINEMLIPEAPPKETLRGLKNADHLNPTDDDVLAAALGVPARRVLMRAEEIGPQTGWKDGYLSSAFGFLAPDPSESPVALRNSPGRVWSDLCERMPGVVARGSVRASILELPLVYGTSEYIPDRALWAATTCLGILASVYRYEERNDGREGLTVTPPPDAFRNLAGDADDEEEETKGIPRNIAIPLRQVNMRMGRILPHLTQFDVSIYNYKIRDPTSVVPYVARCENMDLRWPVFNDRGEAMFLLCMAEAHGCFQNGVELIARCQEAVMNRDNEALLSELIKLKALIDQLPFVFHKISVNQNAGENFANPVEWGQRYAKFSAPLSKRVPALSGLALPVFLTMDAFLGRTNYKSFLGVEAVHLRRWLPLNIRAFIAAIETHYQVPQYIRKYGDARLHGVLEGLVESYAGERGFMGTHRYKVYGFLEVVAKTGRTETNGNSGAGDVEGRPWLEVHKSLSESMIERLEPYHEQLTVPPHEMRGSFEECRFKAPILGRTPIDDDPDRTTCMVTFDLENTGITFQPGDRLAVMPFNSLSEITKVAAAWGLETLMNQVVPLKEGSEWARFASQLSRINQSPKTELTIRDILRRGKLSPLTKDMVMAFHLLLRASSRQVLQLLASEEWPVCGSLGDLLQLTIGEVPPSIWDQAFTLSDFAWIAELIPPEVPRTYSISNAPAEPLPSTIDLIVSRVQKKRHPLLQSHGADLQGVSSGFLNPLPSGMEAPSEGHDEVLIGVSRPINFQLPGSQTAPIAMFAGGSGIAPFRGFLQSRAQSGIGRNVLFLGVQGRDKFLLESELREHILEGSLELYTAFSRDRRGLVYDPVSRHLVERPVEPRYIDVPIVEQGRLVSDLVMSKEQGGLGGHLFICGSVSVYETVMKGIRQAIYKYKATTQASADSILAIAFAERRFMLDIFMTPRSLSYNTPPIPQSKLALNTGHRKGSQMWIGVHGAVYDVTEFLDIHPGGTLIVAASAGLDATRTFDDLAHTSNPEVWSLLSKYFVGHLAPKPELPSVDCSQLYDLWNAYLRVSVESLTTLSFEATNILKDSKVWFSGGLLNVGGVRKFYQFQSRLIQNGFSSLFGANIQEIYLKLAFSLANLSVSRVQMPDIVGSIARAHSSVAATQAIKEIAELGQFVSNNVTSAQYHENGIVRYAQVVTEMDITFLEQVREEICVGMDAFDSCTDADPSGSKQVQLACYLMAILDRIAKRLDSYYDALARESIYQAGLEANPTRARWDMVRRKIFDGSFFVLGRTPEFGMNQEDLYQPLKQRETAVDFTEVFESAKRQIDTLPPILVRPVTSGLSENHAIRAAHSPLGPSTFDMQGQQNALNRMSVFIQSNLPALNRLSRMPTNFNLAEAQAKYGQQSAAETQGTRSRSSSGQTAADSSRYASASQSLSAQAAPLEPRPLAVRRRQDSIPKASAPPNLQRRPSTSVTAGRLSASLPKVPPHMAVKNPAVAPPVGNSAIHRRFPGSGAALPASPAPFRSRSSHSTERRHVNSDGASDAGSVYSVRTAHSNGSSGKHSVTGAPPAHQLQINTAVQSFPLPAAASLSTIDSIKKMRGDFAAFRVGQV